MTDRCFDCKRSMTFCQCHEAKPLPDLIVTRGGVPFADQAEGRRKFMEACAALSRPISIEDRCTAIADKVIPQYRSPPKGRSYDCCSYTAKRWQAAWDGALLALGGDPEEYRR